MGVTKYVDMEFTRRHGISQVQVMVMNPNLIPHTVNIVIGEGLYELKFWVELNVEETKQQPMDMDDNHEDDGSVIEGIMTLLIMRSRRQPVLKHPGGSLNNVKKVNSATGKQVAQATPFFLIQAPASLEYGGGGVGA
jgi:hypothetical protein